MFNGSREGKSRKRKGCIVVARKLKVGRERGVRKVKIGKKGIEYFPKIQIS